MTSPLFPTMNPLQIPDFTRVSILPDSLNVIGTDRIRVVRGVSCNMLHQAITLLISPQQNAA